MPPGWVKLVIWGLGDVVGGAMLYENSFRLHFYGSPFVSFSEVYSMKRQPVWLGASLHLRKKNVDIRIKGRNKDSKWIPMHSFTNLPGSRVLFGGKTVPFLCQFLNVTQYPLLWDTQSLLFNWSKQACWWGQDWWIRVNIANHVRKRLNVNHHIYPKIIHE